MVFDGCGGAVCGGGAALICKWEIRKRCEHAAHKHIWMRSTGNVKIRGSCVLETSNGIECVQAENNESKELHILHICADRIDTYSIHHHHHSHCNGGPPNIIMCNVPRAVRAEFAQFLGAVLAYGWCTAFLVHSRFRDQIVALTHSNRTHNVHILLYVACMHKHRTRASRKCCSHMVGRAEIMFFAIFVHSCVLCGRSPTVQSHHQIAFCSPVNHSLCWPRLVSPRHRIVVQR